MRWLFLIVLFLNFAYIGWQISGPAQSSYEGIPALKNVRPIVLLSELKQQNTKVAAIDNAPSSPEKTPENEQKNVLDKSVADRVVDGVAEKVTDKVAGKVEDGATENERSGLTLGSATIATTTTTKNDEQAKEVAVDGKPSPETKPVVPVAALVEKSVVLAETEVAAVVDKAANKVQEKASCYTVGPFRNLDNLRALTREIKPYVISTDFRGREEREQSLYWVYVQPEKNRKQAIATGKRLKAKKIKDFYIIREGDKINGLSLGHFRNKTGAYKLVKKVKRLGFDVVIEPVFRTYTVYWLDYQLADEARIPETLFEKYTRLSKKGAVSRLIRACKD